ncbi:MAG: hypothetical protein E3K37_05425 [Candidatus Kuenenia sp.]|nr:hypothetical protein [Candidatus Kuenenia hertensis]
MHTILGKITITVTVLVFFFSGIISVYAQKPASLPDFSGLSLYSSDSPLNQPIEEDAEIDPKSSKYIKKFKKAAPFVILLKQYTSPVYIAGSSTTRYDVEIPCGIYWEMGVSKLLNVPIPDWAEPSNDTDGVIPPRGCGEDSDQDNHMVVLDLDTRCEYDFWQMRSENGKWVASWANAISMDSTGIYPAGLSTRGSGFAFLGGLIWPDELKKGEINHALVFAYPYTKRGGPVEPATDSDGEVKGKKALPEGARLRLDPSLDLDSLGLTPAEKTIAKALQKYGMYLVDNGGESGISIYAVDSRSVLTNPYEGLLPDEDYPELSGIPLDKFQVLKLPKQDKNWREKLAIVDTGCNNFK